MTEREPYACRQCGRTVSSLSYYAECPDCGGALESGLSLSG